MIHAQIVLVASPGGARGDFVAGWLGTLPNFIDNFWSIDPLTGKSRGLMDGTKPLDQGASPNDVFVGQRIIPTPDVNLFWAGSCHGNRLGNFVQDIGALPIKILPISTVDADQELIRWEFVTKTFSTPKKTFGSYLHQEPPGIDQLISARPITDQHRAAAMAQHLKGPARILSVEKYMPASMLDNLISYNKLFQPGGSRLLCEVLGVESATDQNHKFWDQMLPAANAPKTIVAWGQEFSIAH